MGTSSQRLAELIARPVSPYCPHEPTPKQHAALVALELKRAVLYGGAAGGGKTDWLLMAALQYVDRPGYHAIIFRRTFPQLAAADGPMMRLDGWLSGTDAVWSEKHSRWKWPNGSTLAFAHMQYVKDRRNHQGAAYHFVGYDELTQFERSQFDYLFSRSRRSSDSDLPIRFAATANPGGPGHEWVSRAWGLGDWEDNGQGLGKAPPDDFAFISAKLDDNPYLDTESYTRSLMALPDAERAQLLHGDWRAKPRGDLIPVERIRIIGPESVPDGRVIRFWDFAASAERKGGRQPDYTASVKATWDPEFKLFVILDATLDRMEPGELDLFVRDTVRADGKGVEQHMEQEPGSSGKISIETWKKALSGHYVEGHSPSGAKRSRWLGFRAAIEQGGVAMVRGRDVQAYLDHLAALTTDEKADEKAGIKDDGMDAGAGAYNILTGVVGLDSWGIV